MRAKRPDATPALLDIILSVLGFMLLLIHNPAAEGMIPSADYTLEVAWPEGINVDVDTYVMRPDDRVMSFRDKDTGHVSIDRDDLGNTNDPAPPNIEITSFRQAQDGWHYVSIHTYRLRQPYDNTWQVHVTLRDKRGRVVRHSAVTLPPDKQETPVMRFLFEDGKLVKHQESGRYIVSMGSKR